MTRPSHDINTLVERSHWLRKEVFELLATAKKGHVPSSYSCAEIVTALYYGGFVKYDAKNPRWNERDRVLISKGHAGMVLYPILADLGFFEKSELPKFTKASGILRLYADPSIPGVESTTGSLGHALGIACGYALSAKHAKQTYNSFVVLGDGECYEGSIWEAAMFASHHGLDNIVTFVDRNQLCIIEETEKCLRLGSIEEKFRAFGWNACTVDGHSYSALVPAINKAVSQKNGKPTAIIANTIKGKGISFMEGDARWHNKIPTDDQILRAREELRTNCISN